MKENSNKPKVVFTKYQSFLVAMLAILQFTIILDFMVMAPMGAILMRVMNISPKQFGLVVSVYAFSAGISGILAAGFADRFDRKKMLLFFYAGFMAGTLVCGLAPDYNSLLLARIITGIFGGVIGSIIMAIIADTFPFEVRGRVMGYVQMAFGVSQVAGIPLGLYLAHKFDWHAAFLFIVFMCVFIGIAIVKWMRPVNEHLKIKKESSAFRHLANTAVKKDYLRAFATTAFISTGGFLIMPFSTAYLVNNVGISEAKLPIVFIVAGLAGLFSGPYIGKLSDRIGKYKMFLFGSVLATIMVSINTHLGITPLWIVLILNTFMFFAITSRMIPSSALISGVPEMRDRGAFMSINSSIAQMGGGIASVIGGMIILESADKKLVNYDVLGYVSITAFVICAIMMYFVDKQIKAKLARQSFQDAKVAEVSVSEEIIIPESI